MWATIKLYKKIEGEKKINFIFETFVVSDDGNVCCRLVSDAGTVVQVNETW